MVHAVSDQRARMLAFYIAVAWVCLAGTGPWTRVPSGLSFALVTLFICLIVLIDFLSAGRRVNLTVPRFLEDIDLRRKMRRVFERCVGKEFRDRFRRLGRAKRRGSADTNPGLDGYEMSDRNQALPEGMHSCA